MNAVLEGQHWPGGRQSPVQMALAVVLVPPLGAEPGRGSIMHAAGSRPEWREQLSPAEKSQPDTNTQNN